MAKKLSITPPGSVFIAVLLVVGVGTLTGIAASANQPPSVSSGEPTMTVRVDNVAAIRPDILPVAENRAANVFDKIGVQLVWIEGEVGVHTKNSAMFSLVLVVDPNRGARLQQDVLGFAAPQAHRAWVFWDRIDELKYQSHPLAFVLGDVMAHELGHLVLSSTTIPSSASCARMSPSDSEQPKHSRGFKLELSCFGFDR